MSRENLAAAAGVAKRTIANFEGGERQPHPATIEALGRALLGADVVFVPGNGEGPGVRLRYHWRDIAIAPRDGTKVYLYCPHGEKPAWIGFGSFKDEQWVLDPRAEVGTAQPTRWAPYHLE